MQVFCDNPLTNTMDGANSYERDILSIGYLYGDFR